MKVSVVTPTYNHAATLPDAIDSVLSQEFGEFEHVVVDDASTDDTRSVVSGYDDERLEYVRLPQNRGANVARNVGIRASAGELIAFLDSDDVFTPDKLAIVMENEPETCAGVFHSFDMVDSEGTVVRTSIAEEGHVRLSDVTSGNPVGGFSDVVLRSRVFEDVGYLDADLPSYQDYEFYLRLLAEFSMRGIPDVLTVKSASVPDGASERISDALARKVAGQEQLREKHGATLSDEVESEFEYTREFLHMRNGDARAARRAFGAAMREYPFDPLYYYHYLAALGGPAVFDAALSVKHRAKILLSRHVWDVR